MAENANDIKGGLELMQQYLQEHPQADYEDDPASEPSAGDPHFESKKVKEGGPGSFEYKTAKTEAEAEKLQADGWKVIDAGKDRFSMERPKPKPAKESKVKELTVPDKHQLKIARDTLKMTDAGAKVMGGPTKEEARAIIKKLTGKDAKESVEEGDGTIQPDEEPKLNEVLTRLYEGVLEEVMGAVGEAMVVMGGENGWAFRGPGFTVEIKKVLAKAIEDGLRQKFN